ncbi:MAG: hypothetical protein ACLRI8_08770 [Agathobacter rectalis]
MMGADILKDITLLDHLVDIARNHHERYDGKAILTDWWERNTAFCPYSVWRTAMMP